MEPSSSKIQFFCPKQWLYCSSPTRKFIWGRNSNPQPMINNSTCIKMAPVQDWIACLDWLFVIRVWILGQMGCIKQPPLNVHHNMDIFNPTGAKIEAVASPEEACMCLEPNDSFKRNTPLDQSPHLCPTGQRCPKKQKIFCYMLTHTLISKHFSSLKVLFSRSLGRHMKGNSQ